jgi:hypothetical protein
MDYEAVGKSFVDSGTSLLALGAFLTSLGWFLLGTYKEANKWLEQWRWFKSLLLRQIVIFLGGVGLLIAGPRMIGEGGTKTTKGWNILSLGEQRSNLIRAVSQEWFMNMTSLGSPPMRGETHYFTEDGRYIRRPFPTLRTYALQAILSSGLWNYGNQKEKDWLGAVSEHERAIAGANRMFRRYDDTLERLADPNQAIKEVGKLQESIPEKEFFKSLLNTYGRLVVLLWTEYKWGIETQMPEVYELLEQTYQEQSPSDKVEQDHSVRNSE